jgi:hypothetical protein
MRTGKAFCLGLGLSIVLTACGGDKDGDGGNGLDGSKNIQGIEFSETSAERCASVAIATLSPFPELGQAVIAMSDAVAEHSSAVTGLVPEGTIDLGDIGFCPTGQSKLTWNDVDGDGELSGGDGLVLTLVDCGGTWSGTLTLDFQDASLDSAEADVDLNVTIEETVDGEPETGTLAGSFHLSLHRFGGPSATAVIRFLVDDQSDGSQGMIGTLNGKTQYELGCFNLYYTLGIGSRYFSLSEPFGVLKVPELGIASFLSFGTPALVFPEGTYPESGGMRLAALSAATPCARVNVPGDGITGNASWMVVTATGSGGVTLSGEGPSGTPFELQRAWSELD